MTDYKDEDFTGDGLYLVHYGRADAPDGPFDSVRSLAGATGLTSYPSTAYVVHYAAQDSDAEGPLVSMVSSLNPDDLLPGVYPDAPTVSTTSTADNTTHHLVNGRCVYCKRNDVSTADVCPDAPTGSTTSASREEPLCGCGARHAVHVD